MTTACVIMSTPPLPPLGPLPTTCAHPTPIPSTYLVNGDPRNAEIRTSRGLGEKQTLADIAWARRPRLRPTPPPRFHAPPRYTLEGAVV